MRGINDILVGVKLIVQEEIESEQVFCESFVYEYWLSQATFFPLLSFFFLFPVK